MATNGTPTPTSADRGVKRPAEAIDPAPALPSPQPPSKTGPASPPAPSAPPISKTSPPSPSPPSVPTGAATYAASKATTASPSSKTTPDPIIKKNDGDSIKKQPPPINPTNNSATSSSSLSSERPSSAQSQAQPQPTQPPQPPQPASPATFSTSSKYVNMNMPTQRAQPLPFVQLPFHGEHRRAVSCLAFAPTSSSSPWSPASNNHHSNSDPSQNPNIRRSGSLAVCASGSADGTVKIWELTNSMLPEAPLAPSDPTRTLPTTFSNSRHLSPLTTLVGHSRGINDVAWSRTAEYIGTASDDKTLRLWDVRTGDALVEFRGHTNFVFSLNFNPQSNLICSGSFDETVKLWDVRSGTCVATLPAHSDPVTGVDFNWDGTCIVSGSHDGLIRVWDTATGECLKTIYAEGNPPVSFVRFSPNGKFVLAGTLDSRLRLWHVDAKSNPIPGGEVGKVAVSSSPNKDALLSSINNIPHNAGLRGGKCTKTYMGHINTKYCTFAAFSVSNPLRQSIVSGSEDGKVYLFDLQSRSTRQVLQGHTDAVLAVAAHDKKEILASGAMANDRTVRFWVPAKGLE